MKAENEKAIAAYLKLLEYVDLVGARKQVKAMRGALQAIEQENPRDEAHGVTFAMLRLAERRLKALTASGAK